MKQRLCVIITILFSWCGSTAQEPFTKDLWLNEVNTPVKVNTLLQDEDEGYIWLGTDEGLYRYDGHEFLPLKDSLHQPVTSIAAYNDEVWVGYKNGAVAKLKQGKWQSVTLADEAPVTPITHIVVQGADSFWLCSEGEGVFRVTGDSVLHITTDNGLSDDFVYTLLVVDSNRVMAATDRGINELMFKDGEVGYAYITTSKGLPDNIIRVVRPIPGICWSWIGTHEGGLALYCSNSHEVWSPQMNTPWQWGAVNDILPLSKEEAWVVTQSGYLLKAGIKDSTNIDIKPISFRGQKLSRLIKDQSGNIWCATNTGIKLITATYLLRYPLGDPYQLNEVSAIACDNDGHIWLAQGKSLYCIEDGRLNKKYYGKVPISALYVDERNRVWIGTLGDGIYFREPWGKMVMIKSIKELRNESVLDITGTKDRIWVAGLNGVEELSYPTRSDAGDMQMVKRHSKSEGVGSDYIYELYADKKGRIWMATDGAGVTMYNGVKYFGWDEDAGMESKVVYSIAEDKDGHIWAATLQDGLLIYNDSIWTTKSKKNGLQDLSISALETNATGEVVIVTGKGVDEWHAGCMEFKHYGRQQGVDSVSGSLNLITKDKEGNVYVPYEEGILVFRNKVGSEVVAPMVTIESVSTFFEEVPYGDDVFPNNKNHISFTFNGISYTNPEFIRYRYKLEGFNNSWIITNDRSITFPQLPSGEYTFVVQSSMNNAFDHAAEATYSFTINKPFWKEVWFIVLMATLIWIAAYTYIRLRERNLKKVARLQKERMVFEYEHLKSQVNPHFLFNSLNTLSSLIEDDQNLAQDYTVHLSDMYRSMLAFRDKDMIPLQDELNIVKHFMYIQKSRFGEAVKMEVQIPDDILQNGKVIPLALQLLVENAMKHNVVSTKQPLQINIVVDKDYIKVSNTLQPKMSKEKGAGLGLVNIRRRYSLLSDKNISYGVNENEFVVLLPLL